MEGRERERERSGPFPFGSEEKNKRRGTETATPTRYLDRRREGAVHRRFIKQFILPHVLPKAETASHFPRALALLFEQPVYRRCEGNVISIPRSNKEGEL